MSGSKFHEMWITDEDGNGLVRVSVGQFPDGVRCASVQRNTLAVERSGSKWGDNFEVLFMQIADDLQKVAARVRDAAPRVQSVMDSAEVKMHPIEAATAESIARFLIDEAERTENVDDRARLHDLSDRVRTGEWWKPR